MYEVPPPTFRQNTSKNILSVPHETTASSQAKAFRESAKDFDDATKSELKITDIATELDKLTTFTDAHERSLL